MLSSTQLVSAATHEAESAALTGGAVIATDHSGYAGSGFVGGFTDANMGVAQAAIQATAPSAGTYNLALRYANGTGITRTLSLYVNGTKIKQSSLPATANWDTWGTVSETVTLLSGNNTIAYKYESTDNGNVNLDNITVSAIAGVNLASGKVASANGSNGSGSYGAANVNDGNTEAIGKARPTPTPTT